MKADLLLKLADMLDANADNKDGVEFDLGVVVHVKHSLENREITSCGTQACAMGLAIISGQFEGLTYEVLTDEFDEDNVTIKVIYEERWSRYDSIAEEMFNLNHKQVDFLFDPACYSRDMRGAEDERIVAKRIRRFVALNGDISDAHAWDDRAELCIPPWEPLG